MSDMEVETDEILPPDRSRLISERRLMAWVRTAFSMIAFGFGIYKVLQFIGEQTKVPLPRPDAPRNLALALIGLGTFALIAGCVQHWNCVRKLSAI